MPKNNLSRRDFLKIAALASGAAAVGACELFPNPDPKPKPVYKNLRGLCYGPFREGQSPDWQLYPSEAQMTEDLNIMKRSTSRIRTYGLENTLYHIPRLCNDAGIECYPCAYVNENATPEWNEAEIQRLIAVGKQGLPTTKGLIVGNEYMLRAEGRGQFLQAKEKIISLVNRVRNETGMPTGTTDGWHLWNYGTSIDLVNACDFIMMHIHPFWESKYSSPNLSVETAVSHVAEKYNLVRQRYSRLGKPVILGETGWPSSGAANYAAVPSQENQSRFIEEFLSKARSDNIDYFIFEAFDESWKGQIENSFGVFNKNREAKPSIIESA